MNRIDPFGLSPKDVEMITKTFHETVKKIMFYVFMEIKINCFVR